MKAAKLQKSAQKSVMKQSRRRLCTMRYLRDAARLGIHAFVMS
jgi:hypothetical protein